MKARRDIAIDILRGLAIFTMVAANMAGSMLIEPHPLAFRFYGSFAAPMFILITGMMTVSTSRGKKHGPGYYLIRGGMILVIVIFPWV